jgi:hypothetical protein
MHLTGKHTGTRHPPRFYAAVIALLKRAPLCLAFSLPSFLLTSDSSLFCTTSSPSVKIISMWHGLLIYGLILPWARYVRRLCFGAWLTWMCLTIKLPVSRPLTSALASAFLRSPRRNSADLTGWRARDTPNCLPIAREGQQFNVGMVLAAVSFLI